MVRVRNSLEVREIRLLRRSRTRSMLTAKKKIIPFFGKLKNIKQSLHRHSQRRRHCFIQNEARDGLCDPLATNFKFQVSIVFGTGIGKPVPISDSDTLSGEYKIKAMKKELFKRTQIPNLIDRRSCCCICMHCC